MIDDRHTFSQTEGLENFVLASGHADAGADERDFEVRHVDGESGVS